ncbi:hypothetical protein XENOCAPTIV_025794 [Xenoophorus captivus]|uniref:N-terminal Ras-GEF domain-containing protein n=1 Tax=Xenoophorus captivus TaxID=1517983 RepID=A0ABV0RDL0_9TELE
MTRPSFNKQNEPGVLEGPRVMQVTQIIKRYPSNFTTTMIILCRRFLFLMESDLYQQIKAKLSSSCPCRAVCTVFSTWLSEYPEDFKNLGDPSRLLRLAPLVPQDSSSAADLRARLLRVAEELSEKALLPDNHRGLCFNWY